MDAVGLVQEAVDVGREACGGAHGVVPQDVDDIVQSVQAVLHLRLATQNYNSKLSMSVEGADPEAARQPEQQQNTIIQPFTLLVSSTDADRQISVWFQAI